jgi:hypothetical protein
VGEYVNAGGVRTYYEVYGEGEPLVLLHGGLATAESWALQVPAPAERYRDYVPERRGHGRTPDPAGPITYEMMAADTAAFLDAAGTGAANLVGWSDRAVVGMLVALRRPELEVIGQYFNFEGEVPEFRAMIDYWRTDLPEALHEVYDRVSPDGPKHFPVVLEKMMRMWLRSGYSPNLLDGGVLGGPLGVGPTRAGQNRQQDNLRTAHHTNSCKNLQRGSRREGQPRGRRENVEHRHDDGQPQCPPRECSCRVPNFDTNFSWLGSFNF